MKIREIDPQQSDFYLQCQFGSEPARYLVIVTEPDSGLEIRVPVCEKCSRKTEIEILEMV